MKETKIQFSSAEMELLSNGDIILTKNKALQKIRTLFEEVQSIQTEFLQHQPSVFRKELFTIPGKISKGENYLGLPYLILDHPRNFGAGNLFAIRTMFWWGNFFSSTLHLSGEYLAFKKEIIKNFILLKGEFYIGINKDPWMHHFEINNYKKIGELTENEFEMICERSDHIKIAAKHPLDNWENATKNLMERWMIYLKICGLIT